MHFNTSYKVHKVSKQKQVLPKVDVDGYDKANRVMLVLSVRCAETFSVLMEACLISAVGLCSFHLTVKKAGRWKRNWRFLGTL